MSGPWIAAFAALALLVAVLAIFVLGLFVRIDKSLTETARHSPLEARSLGGLSVGQVLSVVDFDAPELKQPLLFANSLLLFAAEGCGPCEALVAELGEAPTAGGWQHVLVWDGSDAPLVAPEWLLITGHGAAALRQLFEVRATPFAFAVDAGQRVVATGVPNRSEDLRDLIASARVSEASPRVITPDDAVRVTASSVPNGRSGHE